MVIVGLVGVSAMVIDPAGLQAFFLARLLVGYAGLLLGVVLLWRLGAAIPRSRMLGAAGGGLLVTLGVSAGLARAPVVALLGASGRQLGVLAWLLFLAAFVVGSSLYAPGEERRVLRVLILSSAVATLWVGLVGLLEWTGHPMVAPSQAFPGRVQSTFGNPAVLGAFLTLALPILAAGLVKRVALWLTAPAVGVGLWLLAVSGTRGAWLGMGAAVAYGGVALLAGTNRGGRRRTGVIGMAGLALVGLAAVSVATGRWATAGSGFQGRVATWQVGIGVVVDHPWLGVGPEGFATAFAETVDDEFVITYTRDQVNDRAHSGILDLTITSGLVGLAFYLVIIGGIVLLIIRAGRAGPERGPVLLGLGGAVVAYLVQQQAFFQLAEVDLAFWLIVGLLAAQLDLVRLVRRSWLLVGPMTLAVAFAVVYTGVGLTADRLDRQALRSSSLPDALAHLESAADLRPWDSIHPLVAAGVLKGTEDPSLLDQGLALHERALSWAPDDGVLIVAQSGLLVSRWRAVGNAEDLTEAEEALVTLIARDRTNGEALLRLGAIRYYLGDLDRAEAYWVEAARLMPHRREPLDNLAVLEQERAQGG